MLVLQVLLLVFGTITLARPEYQANIPNGAAVKDVNGNIWPGVGHLRPEGSGPLNPFGQDFSAAGFTWTQELCRKDSDGDGATNGEELGDPHCVWTPGATPASAAVSHPGFPGDVQGTVDTCKEWSAPANTQNMTIQFNPAVTLPAGIVTTYPRQAFNLSDVPGSAGNVDHWAFRFEVIYGGPVEVVHHILLYACTENEVAAYMAAPVIGGGMPCSQGLVFGWAIAYCLPSNVAIKLKKATPFVLMEVHMNNVGQQAISLSPGFKVTVLPFSAPQPSVVTEAKWLWIGAKLPSIKLPPGKPWVELTAPLTFPASPASLEIIASISHMHYLGRRIWVESIPIAASSSSATNLACNPLYDNENQEVIPLNPSINITSNNKLVTHCVYDTRNRTAQTNGGEETEDEMCFVFLLFISNQVHGTLEMQTTATVHLSPADTTVSCEAAGLDPGSYFSSVPTWITAHAILGAIGFGFLMPIGTLFPASRTLRAKGGTWFKAHWIIMSIACIMGWTAFGLGAYYNPQIITATAHGKMGIAVTSLSIFQVGLGKFRPHLPSSPDSAKSTLRKAFEWVHPAIGWTLVGCIAYQLFQGYVLLAVYWPSNALNNWKYAHAIGFFVIWAIVMWILHPPFCLWRQGPPPRSEKQITHAL